jgi:diacylglycerol kinase (ATP)
VPGCLAVVGAAKAEQSPDDVATALASLAGHGAVDTCTVDGPDDLREALAGAPDRVVVLGGDGSVHQAVQALHDLGLATATEVAVVPLGTGNDLARGVGIPLDTTSAARLAVQGRARPVALLEDEDSQVVVNAVHVGVGASAARTAEDAAVGKSALGAAAYSVAAVVAGLRARGWHLRVEVDGEVVHDGAEAVLMVTVGIGRTVGGGAPVAPEADPFAGIAQVSVSRATGWAARLGYAAALRRGRHHHRRDVTSRRARSEVTVSVVHGEDFSTDADGEVAGPFRARTWALNRDAWRLVAP